MTEQQNQPQHTDAELAQRREQAIDRAQGPGPVLDQDEPAPMPLFEHDERARGEVQSAIDPAEFAEFSQRTGEELDHVQPIGDTDELGVAGRAAQVRPFDTSSEDEAGSA
jgi:hypothetical protein